MSFVSLLSKQFLFLIDFLQVTESWKFIMTKISLAISSISFLISNVFLRKCFNVDKQGHFSESLPRLHWTFASGLMGTYKKSKTSHLDLYKEKEKASLLT